MSPETTGLENLWQDLPMLAHRHPRPSACAEEADNAQGPPPSAPVALAPPASSEPPASPAPPSDQGGPSLPGAEAAPSAPETAVGAAPSLLPGVAVLPASPGPPPDSLAVKQRRQLTRLRTALRLSLDPSTERHGSRPELDASVLDVLTELAESDVPPIRLRARFHLLGLCTLAVEDSDRFSVESPESGGAAGWQDAAGLAPVGLDGQRACGVRRPGETLRQGQGRLLWSLLGAWRVKYPEPMSDMVIALASFASRDNPVVDGPRVSR
jgi:hypothetical protein